MRSFFLDTLYIVIVAIQMVVKKATMVRAMIAACQELGSIASVIANNVSAKNPTPSTDATDI